MHGKDRPGTRHEVDHCLQWWHRARKAHKRLICLVPRRATLQWHHLASCATWFPVNTDFPVKQVSGHNSTIFNPNGLKLWGKFIHVWCFLGPSKQRPMYLTSRTRPEKYMAWYRRFFEEKYLDKRVRGSVNSQNYYLYIVFDVWTNYM